VIILACGGSLQGKTIAVLGLTFKPHIDDMRDRASLVIVPAQVAADATVRAYDLEGMDKAEAGFYYFSVGRAATAPARQRLKAKS